MSILKKGKNITMEIADGAFLFEVEQDHCTVKKLLQPDYVLEIPKLVKGKPVTVIGERAFAGCTGVSHLKLPSTISNIKSFAFEASEFKDIQRTINDKSKILYVDRFAFADCSLLEVVEFGGATFLESSGYQFRNCMNLVRVDSLSIKGAIPMGAFMNCGLHMFAFFDGAKISFDAFKDTQLSMIVVAGRLGNTSNFFPTHKSARIICEAENPIVDLVYDGYDVAIKT